MNNKRCWAEIDLEALRYNARVLNQKIGPGARLMAVVKANAYGHGMESVAQALREEVAMFGVANVAEALALRAAGIENPVFILAPALACEREPIVRGGFIPAVSSLEEARGYNQLGESRPVEAHLVLDTGMGRIGLWQEEALEVASQIARLKHLRLTGVATHLPSADEDEAFTAEQLRHFQALLEGLAQIGIRPGEVHALNSAGAIRFPAQAGTLVRAGLALYGCSPLEDFQEKLHPAMAFKASVTMVREMGVGRSISYGRTFTTEHPMRVATVAVGYADGYQRHLSNTGTEVLVGGRRCLVLGRVTMDQICVDVSGLQTQPGDEVVLFGRQGGQEISATELARKAGTIPWEIFTGIGPRVQRIYR